MDQRETMPMIGSPYYMQRQMSEFSEQQGIQQLSNSSMPFQQEMEAPSSGHELFHAPSSSIPTEANPGQSSGIPIRKKRGRPRKYGHGSNVTYPFPSSPPTVRELNSNPTTTTTTAVVAAANTTPSKRGRGRPPGTGRKQQQQENVSGNVGNQMPSMTGSSFTPHVIAIAAGEDIVEKLLSFARQGRRAVCIISVTGTVSSVTLGQASSDGTVTYEGRFDILHMSGSFLPMENDDSLSRPSGLTISLISPDGRVFGGVVSGMLVSASPIQVILGSFVGGNSKAKQKKVKRQGGAEVVEEEIEHRSADTVNPQQSHSPSSSSMGGGAWPSPHAMEMQNSHFDIDLMHG